MEKPNESEPKSYVLKWSRSVLCSVVNPILHNPAFPRITRGHNFFPLSPKILFYSKMEDLSRIFQLGQRLRSYMDSNINLAA